MTVEQLLDECKKITKSKQADYTTGQDRFENFSRCAEVSTWFLQPIDKVYVTLVTVKLARLASLLGRDKTPNNESIEDSFKDLVNYCALWAGDRCQK